MRTIEDSCASSRTPPSSSWLCTSLLLLLIAVQLVKGQEAPTLLANQSTPEINFRSNVCDRQELFYQNNVSIRDTLRGLELHPIFGNWGGEYFSLDSNGRIPEGDDPGFLVELMDKMAQRGGFTWRQSFGVYESSINGNWTELMLWGIQTYDFVVDYYYFTNDRLSSGVTFLPGWFDGSWIIVGEETVTTKGNFFSWLKPFDYRVWYMICITCVLSGVIYTCLQRLEEGKVQKVSNPTDNFFLPALAIVGHFEFHPADLPSMVFTMGLAISSVLLVSAYTANLASFFVVQRVPSLGVVSIEDAIAKNFPICLWKGTEIETYMTNKFPEFKNFVLVADEKELIASTSSNPTIPTTASCRIAITSVTTWDSFKDQRQFNPECLIRWIGRTIKFVPAGMVLQADAGTLCTSLIRDVLTLYLEELKSEGYLADLFEKYLEKKKNQDCAVRAVDEESDNGDGVTLEGLSGVFMAQLGFTTLAILVAVVSLCRSTQNHNDEQATTKRINEATSNRIDEAIMEEQDREIADDDSNQPNPA